MIDSVVQILAVLSAEQVAKYGKRGDISRFQIGCECPLYLATLHSADVFQRIAKLYLSNIPDESCEQESANGEFAISKAWTL